ncbi:hypothetical protein LOTGIDRAFT_238045 [Lottia gigantea]|uniref:Ectonucleoside triphosphate diphosphohydrolase 1 n=1 Tax=Lottia gigantea TaxID=225164 RepID=V4AXK0_LOTGI|nr:hypothetical protein LOTGIDRAFT_238045 [Lottia gigantea]ESP02318.1 hypothetical protein LOTGIDRAFT_238045 [Lottia gigantea]
MACIYILVFLSVIIQPTFPKIVENHPHHGVILDAGSSSIKVRIYQWIIDSHKHTNVPKIHLVHNERIKVNLAKYAREPDMLELQLLNAIDVAVQYINQSVHHEEVGEIPLFLMSTAGTRTLSSHDARYFVRTVRRLLSNSTTNPFYFKPRHVEILSGEEEGVYSWLSVNYLLGVFNLTSGLPVRTVGILEMGGGSTQIAFIPRDPLYDGEFHVYMDKKRYELYVHSYLNYGQNYIKNRVNSWLLHHHHGNKTHIPDPCRLKGDTDKVKTHNHTKIIYGSGNVTQCRNIIQIFLKKAEGDGCSPKPCAIGSVYQPNVTNITFYAIGAFKYAPGDLGAIDSTKRLNITKFNSLTEKHCAKNFSALSKKDRQYGREYCLMGVYISLLLTQSYGFNKTTTNIIVTDRIHGVKTDWSLGIMLHEIMERNALKPYKPVVEINCPNLGNIVSSNGVHNKHSLLVLVFILLLVVFMNLVDLPNYIS